MKQKLFNTNTSPEGLWILFKMYGYHDAGVEICDRANYGDPIALVYANRIWKDSKRRVLV